MRWRGCAGLRVRRREPGGWVRPAVFLAVAALAHLAVLRHLPLPSLGDLRVNAQAASGSRRVGVDASRLARTDMMGTTLLELVPPSPEPLPAATVPPAPRGDWFRWDAPAEHPDPRALADVPDPRAAPAGGGAIGGPLAWSGRVDDVTLGRLLWSSPDGYVAPRTRSADADRSPTAADSVPDPAPGFVRSAGVGSADAAPASRARPGLATAGALSGSADLVLRPDGTVADATRSHRIDRDPPAATRPGAGAVSSPVLVDRGRLAVPVDEPGEAEDSTTTVAASDLGALGPLEATRPSAGGPGSGVAGPADGPAPVATGVAGAQGLAATEADVATGPTAALRAVPGARNPYLQGVYARVAALWSFPRSLALDLEQGTVIVAFTIEAGGSVRDVRVIRSSGFREFDANAMAAVERAAPFPPVPAALGGGDLRVSAPFEFDNPLVR